VVGRRFSKYGGPSALDGSHRLTTPSTCWRRWSRPMAVIALAADFYLQIAAPPIARRGCPTWFARRCADGPPKFASPRWRAAVTKSGKQAQPAGALWARRLRLGEAITQAQYVLVRTHELVDLVVSRTGRLTRGWVLRHGCSAPPIQTYAGTGSWPAGAGRRSSRELVRMATGCPRPVGDRSLGGR